ncbi:FMN-binding protein [Eubacteriales bacterium OttesenSCG-928-K08]|nr:FMN-binding protein [Eubacteriales bacterium OttesenSCG-928-K08]
MIFNKRSDIHSLKPTIPALCRVAALILLLCVFFTGCSTSSGSMQDGYYTAIAEFFDDFGWKEYVTIYVSDNRIITVEYNASNSSGFIKSWDMDYMRTMNAKDGTYPNKYTREYADALLNEQDPYMVDAITGATHSYTSFQMLAEAAITKAQNGDKTVAYVNIPPVQDSPASAEE